MEDVIFEVKIEMLLQLAISIGREFHTLGPLRNIIVLSLDLL